jgi:hypothetical protein
MQTLGLWLAKEKLRRASFAALVHLCIYLGIKHLSPQTEANTPGPAGLTKAMSVASVPVVVQGSEGVSREQ